VIKQVNKHDEATIASGKSLTDKRKLFELARKSWP